VEEFLQVVDHDTRYFFAHVSTASSNVGSNDGSSHRPQNIANGQWFQWVCHVQSTTKPSATYFLFERREIHQTSARDVDHRRAIRQLR
jgi:hypothetical protein